MKPVGCESLPLFSPERPDRPRTATHVGLAARDATASKHEAQIAKLIPVARELAAKAGTSGVTVSDLRITAVQRGILSGTEPGRSLSYLGSVMERAGLARTGEYRRSVIVKTHGNLGACWRLPAEQRSA